MVYFFYDGLMMVYMAAGNADLSLFIGRFHPLLVHLPIGFLLFAVLLEFTSLIKKYEALQHAVPFALLMGLLSAIAAGITGFLLSESGGYGDELLNRHKWLGTSIILLAFAAYLVRVFRYDHPVFKRFFHLLLIVLTAVVMAAGHYGGSLTHGADYLFRYMPQSMKIWFDVEFEEEEEIALIEDLDNALIFDHIIQPIIQTRCESCHNPDRTEGDLLLTSFSRIMEGGENGPVIISHNAGESEFYTRLILPERDENRMPPRGRTQLTGDQIKLMEWWIDHGVPSTQTVSDLDISDDISSILEKLTVGGQSFLARTSVAAADPETLEHLNQRGFRISPIADGIHFLQVKLTASKNIIHPGELEALLPVSEQITWIDFARIELDEAELDILAEFKNLTRLNLAQTNIGDAVLEKISTLENLEYLNLYSTNVTGEGLQYIEHLENLESLYLWGTHVSAESAEHFQEKMPFLYINYGAR